MTTINTPDGMAFAQLAAFKTYLGLEIRTPLRPSRKWGGTAYTKAKKKYGIRGSREKVYGMLVRAVEAVLAETDPVKRADLVMKYDRGEGFE
jgi:hypothetical protein